MSKKKRKEKYYKNQLNGLGVPFWTKIYIDGPVMLCELIWSDSMLDLDLKVKVCYVVAHLIEWWALSSEVRVESLGT